MDMDNNENKENQLKHMTAVLVLAAVFIMGVYAWDARYDGMAGAAAKFTRISPAAGTESVSIGAHWELTDHHNNKVNEGSYGDKYKLVFFGFASCPDICPTTLQKIAKTIEMLDTQGSAIQPLFISTDPATDTPEVLARYVTQYSPQFIGLTGTQQEIDNTLESFHAYAEKIDDGQGGYFMNHSSVVYFMSPDNKLISVFDSTDSPVDMVKEIRHALPQG